MTLFSPEQGLQSAFWNMLSILIYMKKFSSKWKEYCLFLLKVLDGRTLCMYMCVSDRNNLISAQPSLLHAKHRELTYTSKYYGQYLVIYIHVCKTPPVESATAVWWYVYHVCNLAHAQLSQQEFYTFRYWINFCLHFHMHQQSNLSGNRSLLLKTISRRRKSRSWHTLEG